MQHHGHAVTQGGQIVLAGIHTAHAHSALAGIIQAGDQLHKRGFARARAAQHAYNCARGDVQVDIAQAVLFAAGGIAEADVIKIHRAVAHGLHRILGGYDIALFIQHFHNALRGGTGHGDHHEYHG